MDSVTPLQALNAVEGISTRGSPSTRTTYIFIGGAWSHSRGLGGLEAWASEQQPTTDALEATQWRKEVEQAVLSSEYHGIPGV